MGKKQEISTEQDFDVFKILYTSSCREAGIGLQNKAAALHALIQKLSENPDDDKIKDLFFQTLADLELLCTNFHDYSNYGVRHATEHVKRNLMERKTQDRVQRWNSFPRSFVISLAWRTATAAF